MKRAITLTAFAAAAVLAGGAQVQAGALETVGASGTHATVQAAIAAVDDNGVIEIVDAGTLTGAIDLGAGPANYTIRKAAAVVGEVILTNGNAGFVVYNAIGFEVAGNSTRVIEGVTLERNGGTGVVIDVDQSNLGNGALTGAQQTATLALTLNDCIVRHTGPVSGDVGEAIKLDDGYAGGAAVIFNANNCTISTTGEGASQKAAIRVQDAGWDNLTVNLNNCTISNPGYRVIRNDGTGLQNWTITDCTINGVTSLTPPDGYGRAIHMTAAHSNSSFTITGSTVTTREEALIVDGTTGTGNTWTISGNTFDNTAAATDATVRIIYSTADSNSLRFFNNVVKTGEGSNATTNRSLNLGGFGATSGLYIYNNTFVGGGNGTAVGIAGTGVQANAWNNLFLNYVDTVTGVMGGSYTGTGYDTDNNIIVGPADDGSKGSNGAYISTTAGLANALTAAGLDSNFKPTLGSAVLGAGATTNAALANSFADILASIGSVDRDGAARQTPPDVGAFELADPSTVSDWQILD
ncbi:hypothetical protein GC173_05240 [bacterium]|nr:hypothetical protein [bacterium]